MFLELEVLESGWIELKVALKEHDIDELITNLQLLKKDTSQHFHISSDYNDKISVGDVEIYVDEDARENAHLVGLAIEPNR